jgi:hypothetical protein
MILSGLAALVHFAVHIAAHRQNKAREVAEEEVDLKLRSRSWLENFLDPQLLNTPKHIQLREDYFETLMNPSRTYRVGLLLPSLSLVVILLIRLFLGAPVFLGDPASLDFGWKYGIDNGDDAEKIIAYVPEAISYLHSMQGVFSALLATPVLMRGLIRLTNGRLRSLFLFAPYALTMYPTYNLIKRFILHRHFFAGSSFANNGLEWASGFILGLAMGQLITAMSSCLYMIAHRREEPSSSGDEEEPEVADDDETDAFDDDDDLKPSCFFRFLQKLFGLLLVFTVFAVGVLSGLTWYSCEEGTNCVNADFAGDDAHSYSSKILSIMVVVPSVIMVGGSFFF